MVKAKTKTFFSEVYSQRALYGERGQYRKESITSEHRATKIPAAAAVICSEWPDRS